MTLTGVEIDITRSNKWSIYFSSGTYTDDYSYIRFIESFLLNLDEDKYKDYPTGTTWDIRYIPETNTTFIVQYPYTEDCLEGHSIGGFIIRDCDIKFVYPFDGCITYKRLFSTEFTNEYQHTTDNIDTCTGEYYEHNSDFMSDFTVIETIPN